MPRILPHNALERRITERLVAYWERVRKGREMPSADDIDPEDLADLWDCCFLMHVRDAAAEDYHYAYIGMGILEAGEAGLPADGYADQKSALIGSKKGFNQVISARKPVIEEGEFLNAAGDLVKFRRCMLPLGKGGQVQAVFGGMRFKIFPKRA